MQNILIVDHDEDFVSEFTKSLKDKIECKIIHAVDGTQALSRIKAMHFSLIIIENSVTNISGFELVGNIKSNLETKSIPLIILSEKQDQLIIKRYVNLEIDVFMYKPLDMKVAIEKIDRILAKQRKKIMIIDDHAGTRAYLERIIRTKFFRDTIAANNGIEALKLLQSEKPVLIMLDFDMPEMSGLDFIKKLRSEKKYEDISVVVLSGNTDIDLIKEMAQYNITDYLAKPISIHELTAKLTKHFE